MWYNLFDGFISEFTSIKFIIKFICLPLWGVWWMVITFIKVQKFPLPLFLAPLKALFPYCISSRYSLITIVPCLGVALLLLIWKCSFLHLCTKEKLFPKKRRGFSFFIPILKATLIEPVSQLSFWRGTHSWTQTVSESHLVQKNHKGEKMFFPSTFMSS